MQNLLLQNRCRISGYIERVSPGKIQVDVHGTSDPLSLYRPCDRIEQYRGLIFVYRLRDLSLRVAKIDVLYLIKQCPGLFVILV